MRGLEMNDSVCLQRQVGVQHGPSHSITVVLPLLRGVSGWLFSPKSFGLCKLSFWALVKANTKFALHWIGWLFHVG